MNPSKTYVCSRSLSMGYIMVNSIKAFDAIALPFKHHCTSVYWRNVIKDECSGCASVLQIELLLRSVWKEMRWKKGEKADLTSPQKPIKPQDTPKHTSHKSTRSPLKGNTEGQLNVSLCVQQAVRCLQQVQRHHRAYHHRISVNLGLNRKEG